MGHNLDNAGGFWLFWGQEFERITHLHQIIASGILAHNLKTTLGITNFTNSSCTKRLHHSAQLAQKIKVFWTVLRIDMLLVIIRVHRWGRVRVATFRWQRRIVAQLGIMKIEIDSIQSKPINAAVQPKRGHIQQRILYIHIMEIQVRLGHQKVMQIILLAAGIPLPCGPTENRQPVIGRCAIWLGLCPDIPIAAVINAVGTAFHKPRMHV